MKKIESFRPERVTKETELLGKRASPDESRGSMGETEIASLSEQSKSSGASDYFNVDFLKKLSIPKIASKLHIFYLTLFDFLLIF